MNTQQTPENGRGTPVVKNVTEIGNGQLVGILSVFVAVAGVLVAAVVFGFYNVNRRIDDLATLTNTRIDDLTTLMNAQFDDVDRRFDDVDRRFDDVNRRFDDVNRRIDDNAAELRLIRGDVSGLSERMTKVETIIDFRPQAEADGKNNPIAASTPRDQL